MLDLKKIISATIISMSLVGVGANVAQAANFTAPKLGVSEIAPTNPAIKKGDQIFVTIKDAKNQTVTVLNAKGQKTTKKVTMGSTFTVKAIKQINHKKIVRINHSNWLNTKDIVKD